MKNLNQQIAHELLRSYVHNKEATHLYQTGFAKAANFNLELCENHINKASELITKAMKTARKNYLKIVNELNIKHDTEHTP